MIGHPREETLLAFQDHRLDDRRRRRLAGHLSGCQRCRNVVQAHRTVRGVFAFEAPFAPDGVLERALASRAGGMLVVLPVAEPDVASPRIALPRRGFVIAAGMVLTVLAGLQMVPNIRLRQVWGAWSGMIAEWQPFSGDGIMGIGYPSPPVAKAAVIEPDRIRPLRARYRWNSLRDGKINASHTYTLELSRLQQSWRVQSSGPGERTWSAILSDSLRPLSWFLRSKGRRNLAIENDLTFWDDSLRRIQRVFLEGRPVDIGDRYTQAFDSTWRFARKVEHPVALSDEHLHLLFAGIPIRRGWAGSIDFNSSPKYWRGDPGGLRSYLAVGDTIITTAAGRFEAVELNELYFGSIPVRRFWISKSTGLVVRATRGGEWGSEIVLESVTFP